MKTILYAFTLILAVSLGACAPLDTIGIQTVRPPVKDPSAEPGPRFPYSVVVRPLKVASGVPTEFRSNSLFTPIKYNAPFATLLQKNFADYILQADLFNSVAIREDEANKPKLYIRGSVKKFNWSETGSIWMTAALSVATLAIWPLCGGAINWPAGEAEIEVIIEDQRTGETVYSKTVSKRIEESLSIYSSKRDTPAAQLLEAYTGVCEQIAADIRNNSILIDNNIATCALKPSREEKAAEAQKPEEQQPLKVLLVNPQNGAKICGRKVEIAVSARGPTELSSVVVLLNDQIVIEKLQIGSKEIEFKENLDLKEGRSAIMVIALDILGGKSKAEAEFFSAPIFVEILQPASGAKVNSPVKCKFRILCAEGIAEYTISIDGKGKLREQPGTDTIKDFEELLILASGRHVVEIQALDRQGNVGKASITLNAEESEPGTAPVPPPVEDKPKETPGVKDSK